jgi:23S rRNA (uridine2552-2'-O)-methyltransferase
MNKKPSKKTTPKRLIDGKKRTESSKRWLLRQINDPYVLKAKTEGYRSRAAFKLAEINEKYKIIKNGNYVVDLGAAPGGWSQIASDIVKDNGKVVAVDLQDIEPVNRVIFHQGDFTEDATLDWIHEQLDSKKVHCVISDMAAPACGMNDVDHWRIMYLVELVFDFSKKVLKPGGHMVAKVLRGGTETKLLTELKKSFEKVVHFKPKSSRQDSAEMYLVAMGFRQNKS